GVALGLHGQRRHLGVKALVDPDAANLQAVAAEYTALGRLGQSALEPEVVRLDRQVHTQAAGLDTGLVAAVECRVGLVERLLGVQGVLQSAAFAGAAAIAFTLRLLLQVALGERPAIAVQIAGFCLVLTGEFGDGLRLGRSGRGQRGRRFGLL